MDGSRRRLAIAGLTLILAGCTPAPAPTRTPAPAAPTPAPTSTLASPTPTAAATPAASTPPISIALPPGFDAIPWASAPYESATVTFGVLGKPATGTRQTTNGSLVQARGRAILIPVEGGVEIVDAGTGELIAMYDPEAIALEDVPRHDLRYLLATRRVADVDRGFLYDLSANRAGVQLRRFDLSGGHEIRLATLAPDPGRDIWHTDFVVGPTGEVIATACPIDRDAASDFRCRIYRIAPGTEGPVSLRFLPAGSPRPCRLLAASESWLIGTHYRACDADGGLPTAIPHFAINLETLAATTTIATTDLNAFGAFDGVDGVGTLVANVELHPPLPDPYPAIAVTLRFDGTDFGMDQYVEDVNDPAAPLDQFESYVWAIRGWGPGWALLHGFGPEFVACQVVRGDTSPPCASGPEVLETPEGWFVLPPGTYGEIVPPVGYGVSF